MFLAVIDPAWSADGGGGGRGANEHYALDDVSGIYESYWKGPAWPQWCSFTSTAPGDALVFMWATAGAMAQHENGNPPDAYVLARLLGVRVAAIFTWCKIDEEIAECGRCGGSGSLYDPGGGSTCMRCEGSGHVGAFTPPARMGLGQWSRVEHEYLLLCRRGTVPVPPPEVRPRSVIYAPRGEHSAKPERAWSQVIEPIAKACAPGVTGVEFNCRVQRAGWAAVGRLDGEDNPIVYRGATHAAG